MSYTDVFNQDPSLYGNTSMPTVDTGAAIAGLSQPAAAGLTPPGVASQAGVAPPVVPGVGDAAAKPGFFSQYGPAQFALGAIQTLGSLWNSFQQNKLAKESFNFQKEAYATNLANQESTYNTALDDRIRSRYSEGTRTEAELSSEIADKSL